VLDLLADEVRARVDGAGEPDAIAAGAADLLESTGGNLPVAALARELAVSERHLHRRTIAALGYGPKTFARIVRFQRALALLEAGRPPADVAATAGYADQPHLTREMQALAGRSPRQVMSPPSPD
jgi:AraC-like DNA-binding protein